MIGTSRRNFLKNAGASALVGTLIPSVYAQGGDEIRLVLIGCGGRGTGAAADALTTQARQGPIKLVALADLTAGKIKRTYDRLAEEFPGQTDVPEERRFTGLDGYRKAMDCLRPGDVAIFATPPAFRWVFLQYAISKRLNVFLEKPVTVDGPTSLRMLKLAREADAKNLKVGVGLMVRHCRGRQELVKRIRDGEIGEIVAARAYRMHGPGGYAFSHPKPADITDLMYQIQRFHSFLWAGGGLFSDFYIHQVDEISWIKGAWPVSAHGLGGRHYRGDMVDQNFDTYHIEYAWPDGSKFFYDGRTMTGCKNTFFSGVHGTKGSAVVSLTGHTPGRVRTFRDQSFDDKSLIWAHPQPEENPYLLEWADLIDAIRNDTPYNEVPRGVEASVVSSMGRMAAHTGQVITYEQMLNCPHEFAPGLDTLTEESPAPLQPDAAGRYPVPEPGVKNDREY